MREMHLGAIAAFDWTQYRPEDLELRIEVCFVGRESGVKYFQPMSEDVSAYEDAKRRILALDGHGHLDGFQIPISFLFKPRVEHAIAQLECMITGRSMAWGPQARNDAPFLLEVVKMEPSRDSLPCSLKLSTGERHALLDSRTLAYQSHPFMRPSKTIQPSSTGWQPIGRSHSRSWPRMKRRLSAPLKLTPACTTGSKQVALCITRFMDDDTFLADMLYTLSQTCPSLSYIELERGLLRKGWNTMGRAVAARASKSQPANPQPLASSVRAFAMRLDDMTVGVERVIDRLSGWLPCLQSLVLMRGKYNIADEACFRQILQAFPLLVSLTVGRIKLTTWQELLDAYETRVCRIRTLVVWTEGGMTSVPLVETLASPSTRMAWTMAELQIGTDCFDEAHRVLVAAEAMLEKNRFLDYYRVMSSGNENEKDEDRVRRFHRESLPKPGMDRTGFRVAFLSRATIAVDTQTGFRCHISDMTP